MQEVDVQGVSENTPLNPDQKKRIIEAIGLCERGDSNNALSILFSVAEESQNSLPYTCIGNCYRQMGDFGKAKSYYEKAIELPVTTAHPYITLGNLYYEEGNVNRAILLWSAANTLVADNGSLLLNLATAYTQKDLRIQAIQYYQKFINFSSKNASPQYDEIYTKISRLRAIASNSNNIATKYFNAKNYSKALEHYLTSVMNYPLQPQISYLVGNMFFNMNDFNSAVEHWTNAYLVSDFNPSYLGLLPFAYEKLNKPSYAYCFYYSLMASHSQHKIPPDEIKQKLLNLGIIVYEKNSDYSDMHFRLGQRLEMDNNYLMAHVEYNNALILTKNNKKKIEDCLSKMTDFLHPELRLISSMQLMVSKCMKENNFEQAIKICDKILAYSQSNSQIEAVIRRKKDECLRLSKISKN